MKTISLLSIMLGIPFLLISQSIEFPYNFNNLSTGNLNGKDNWVTIQHTTGTADIIIDVTGNGVVSPDGTQAAFYTAGGPGWGRTATRKATTNFNFDFAVAEVYEVEIDMHLNWWGMFFGVGFDADGDGHIAPGLPTEPNDGGIMLAISEVNPTTGNKMTMPDGSEVIFNINNSGWTRYKMVLDFSANGGAGAVALFYKPGTTGDWLTVSEVQGVSMGLTPGSGDKRDRMVWDGIFFHSQGATGVFDNILIRQPENAGQLQFIEFSEIPDKLTTSPSFTLAATATSGLPVTFAVTEGPATVNGNVVTLTGEPGMVTIKASQPGNANWAPAPDVFRTFEVVDPYAYSPALTIRRPADDTKAYMTSLSKILLVASAYIEHPEVLHIEQVSYQISGQGTTMTEKVNNSGYYIAEWTPPAFGVYTMTIVAVSTGGMETSSTLTFEVTDDITDLDVPAFDMVWLNSSQTSVTQDFVFPTYVGSFDQITAYLDITCPTGGCEAWDRVGSMEAKGPTGQWIEIMRYITPYGVPCDHNIDVTDYSSIFQGLVEMRFTLGVIQNGFVVDVNFDFHAGTPQYKYSWIDVIWQGTFPFGDYLNLQPMDTITWNFAPEAEGARLKIINTGHGWGTLNTGNAAEFYEATHKIKVNNNAFDQHLWVDCNPNPDGCQPQNGTWFYDRAGWCPGSISYVYNYELTPYVNMQDIQLVYEFYPGYVDYCHPNHPNCVTGVTCADCSDTYNPNFIISGQMVSYSNSELLTDTDQNLLNAGIINVYPNPSDGIIELSSTGAIATEGAVVRISTIKGTLIDSLAWDGNTRNIDLTGIPKGIYLIQIVSSAKTVTKKLVVQ